MRNMYASRKWLNSDKDKTAFIACNIEDGPYAWGEVKIADCGKLISLEFPTEDSSDKRKSLKKLDLMISELEKFREVLEEK